MSIERRDDPIDDAWPYPDALDAVIAAPQHHILLLENDRVRVLETVIRPGERTAVHTHRWPMMIHVLSRSDFVRYDERGVINFDTRRFPAKNEPSKVMWSEPLPPHALENVGGRDLHVISVEVKA
jgi:hypothetical protein